jgi:serine/threonine protein kinase
MKEVYNNTHAWCQLSEIWSLGAVVYTMMTGMPPPRNYEYDWQISRMGDKGFGKDIRGVVTRMLHPDMTKRPETLILVDEVESAWKSWRAYTQEGREYVDVRDDYVKKAYESSQLGA